MKKIIAILAAVLMLTAVLTACGEKKTGEATPDSAAATKDTAETTRVKETTAGGNTLEEDAEGNVLEISKDGELVSVKDKNGDPVDVDVYLTTHTVVTADGYSFGGGDTASSDDENGSGSAGSKTSSKAEGKGESGSSQQDKPSSREETVSKPAEEETIELDEYELPIV